MRRGELFPLRLVLPNGDKERRKKTKEEERKEEIEKEKTERNRNLTSHDKCLNTSICFHCDPSTHQV